MIRAQELTKRYRETIAVDGLTLKIPPGEIYALLGPNGAGKSTTLRMLAGVMEPSAGTVEVCGFSPSDQPLDFRRSLGFLSEDTGLYKRLSARELLLFFGSIHDLGGAPLKNRIAELTEFIGLKEFIDRPIRKLSCGQRQRVNLARVLLHDPDVLILDEATANLDIVGRRFVMDILASARARGKAIILSTHIMSEAETVCDRVGLIHKGRLIAEGSKEKLLELQGGGTLADAFLDQIQHVV